MKKGIIFIGGGDTGKTTMLNLLIKLIGEENMSGISLQAISGDKFSVANLYGKHINIYDDLSALDLQDTGRFKMITGNGWISGQRKFGDEFQFKNFAKLTFSANIIPTTKKQDDDEAYYKRWLIIRFDNVFDKKNKATNKNLIEEISSKNELSGLLNWAIIGLERLLKKQDFSCDKEFDEIKKLMEKNSSDIAKFAQECCEKGEEEDWLSKDEMFEHYKEYTVLNGLSNTTKEMLGRHLTKFCDYISDSRKGQITGWRFVKVKKIKPVFGV